MSFKTTLVLVALLAVVGGYFFFVERGREPGSTTVEVSEAGRSLLGESAADAPEREAVRQVAVRRGEEQVVLYRESDAWWQVEPVRFGVRRESAERIVDAALGLTWRERFVPGESAEADGGEDERPTLEAVGLDAPRAELMLTAGDETWTVRLGRRTLDGQGYVQLAGDERVYIVDDGLHRAVLDETIRDWRRRQLEAPPAARAERVTLEQARQTVELTKHDGRWYLDVARGERASEAAVDELVEAVRSLSIASFVADADSPGALRRYGLNEPRLMVTVQTPDVDGEGEAYVLRVGAAADLAERAYYATWSVNEQMSPVVFSLEEREVDRLALGREALRDPRMVTTQANEVSEVHVERGDQPALHLVRDADVGYRFGEDGPGYGVDYTAANELIEAITGTQATGYVTDFEAAGEPMALLTLTRRGGRTEQVRLYEDVRPDMADEDGDGEASEDAAETYLAVREDEQVAYRVSAEALAGVFAPQVAYRDMELLNVRASDVAAVTLQREDDTRFVFTRNDEGAWQLDGDVPLDEGALEGLLGALRPLRASRWLDASAASLAGGGYDTVLTVRTTDGTLHVLHANVQTREGTLSQTDLQGTQLETDAVPEPADDAMTFELPRSIVDRLRGEYRPRTVLSMRMRDIEQVRRERGDEVLTLRRTSSGQYLSDADREVREQPAAALFDTLSSLNVWRYIEAPADLGDTPEQRYVIERADGEDTVLELWHSDVSGPVGRIGERWFQLDRQTVDVLYAGLLEDEQAVEVDERPDVPVAAPRGEGLK